MRIGVVGIPETAFAGIRLSLGMRWPNLETVPLELFPEGDGDLDFVLVGSPSRPLGEKVREVRSQSSCVLIALSEDLTDTVLVEALEAGADDCLALDAGGPQLIARVAAALRQTKRHDTEWLSCGDLRVSISTHEARVGNEYISFTPTEFKLVHLLVKNKERVVSHEMLQAMVWGTEGSFYTNSVRKYIQRVRTKLPMHHPGCPSIITVARIGYRIDLPERAPQPSTTARKLVSAGSRSKPTEVP